MLVERQCVPLPTAFVQCEAKYPKIQRDLAISTSRTYRRLRPLPPERPRLILPRELALLIEREPEFIEDRLLPLE